MIVSMLLRKHVNESITLSLHLAVIIIICLGLSALSRILIIHKKCSLFGFSVFKVVLLLPLLFDDLLSFRVETHASGIALRWQDVVSHRLLHRSNGVSCVLLPNRITCRWRHLCLLYLPLDLLNLPIITLWSSSAQLCSGIHTSLLYSVTHITVFLVLVYGILLLHLKQLSCLIVSEIWWTIGSMQINLILNIGLTWVDHVFIIIVSLLFALELAVNVTKILHWVYMGQITRVLFWVLLPHVYCIFALRGGELRCLLPCRFTVSAWILISIQPIFVLEWMPLLAWFKTVVSFGQSLSQLRQVLGNLNGVQ